MVFIYGPPAVGKSTVSKELSTMTGFRYFVNHQASDPVAAIVDFENNKSLFRSIANDIKDLILERAVDIGLPGLIMTFCYSPPDSDRNLGRTRDMLSKKGGVTTSFVRLSCSDDELVRRVQDPSRKLVSVKKLSNPQELRRAMAQNNFNLPIPYVDSLDIDTTHIPARDVADMIARNYGFPPYTTPSPIMGHSSSHSRSQDQRGPPLRFG